MKIRVSATIDEETEAIISELVKKRLYRNKSHVIEEAILSLKGVINGKGKK
jgi:Arc/MetJ-type ribon-helix-helix transcriptional regulator